MKGFRYHQVAMREPVFNFFDDSHLNIHSTVFVHPTAVVTGKVILAEQVSIWPLVVIRGDINFIQIGARSNIQDLSVIHVADNDPVIVGEDVVAGHRVILHGCKIGNGVLVGMGAIVSNGVVIGEGSIIGEGALVTSNKVIPPNSLVLGSPGKVVRETTAEERENTLYLARKYQKVAERHREQLKKITEG